MPKPTLADVGTVSAPTRRLPPGAWANTCRGKMVYLTEVVMREDETYLDPEVPRHPVEPRRVCVRLAVAAKEEGGFFALDSLTGPTTLPPWENSAREQDAAGYRLSRSEGSQWPGAGDPGVANYRMEAELQHHNSST